MRISKQAVASLVVAVVVGGAAVAVIAADAFHDRHMAMEAVGDAMKPLGAMAKKAAPFDAAVVKASATTIADNLKKAQGLFPAGSGGGESRAKAEIWTDAAGFEKGMKDVARGGRRPPVRLGRGRVRPRAGALGGSCKSCHDKYRLPKQ